MIKKEIGTPTLQDRRTFMKKVLGGTLIGSMFLVFPANAAWSGKDQTRRFGFLVDINACIGCGSCCVADRAEYHLPAGKFRTWVERYVIDGEGNVFIDSIGDTERVVGRRATASSSKDEIFFVPKLCRMCEEPVCRDACPTGATFRTRDGFVLIDNSRCNGCSSCLEACPHSVRYLDPMTGKAAKCTWCHERVQIGLLPLCVTACPARARKFGDLNDQKSEIWKILNDPQVASVKEFTPGSLCALYYVGWQGEVV